MGCVKKTRLTHPFYPLPVQATNNLFFIYYEKITNPNLNEKKFTPEAGFCRHLIF
jgi:hypothetical protein